MRMIKVSSSKEVHGVPLEPNVADDDVGIPPAVVVVDAADVDDASPLTDKPVPPVDVG